jgi:1-acyl-sn-glycerol-3-phosphate acyltransferase
VKRPPPPASAIWSRTNLSHDRAPARFNKKYVPKKGAVILASNHISFLDHFLVPAVISRKIVYLAKAEHFDTIVGNFFFSNWGQIPVQRGKGDLVAFKRAIEHLNEGGILGIYPEGTRSLDGYIHEGKTGVARLALLTGAPVIPVGMRGTFEAMPKGQHVPIPKKVDIYFGPPMDFSRFKGLNENRELTQRITDEILFEIEKLSKPRHKLDPDVKKAMLARRKLYPLESFLSDVSNTPAHEKKKTGAAGRRKRGNNAGKRRRPERK